MFSEVLLLLLALWFTNNLNTIRVALLIRSPYNIDSFFWPKAIMTLVRELNISSVLWLRVLCKHILCSLLSCLVNIMRSNRLLTCLTHSIFVCVHCLPNQTCRTIFDLCLFCQLCSGHCMSLKFTSLKYVLHCLSLTQCDLHVWAALNMVFL